MEAFPESALESGALVTDSLHLAANFVPLAFDAIGFFVPEGLMSSPSSGTFGTESLTFCESDGQPVSSPFPRRPRPPHSHPQRLLQHSEQIFSRFHYVSRF